MSAFNSSSTTIKMMIPSSRVSLVIGRNGDIIRQLQEENGVEMFLDQVNAEQSIDYKPLRITGEPGRVAYVQSQVQRLIFVCANSK